MKLQIDTARVFVPLLQPARYKGAHGGRGSGKSHFFAEMMIEEHLMYPGFRSVCLREVQDSLKDSAKLLLEDKIKKFGLEENGFRILNDQIRTPGDGVIIFKGLKDQNAESIKSLEGFDRAWCEEAQTITKHSLKLLRPTIRKDNSELWFSWNPRFKSDAVEVLLRGGEMPTDAKVIEVNWNDNPWFPNVLEIERQDDLRLNPDEYDHIWEGGYKQAVEGAYYAKHIALARKENRIGRVASDPLMKTYVYCDIGGSSGKSDAFAMWAVQFIGKEVRVLKHYEAIGQEVGDHVYWLRENGLDRAIIKLPHDGKKHESMHRITWESEFKKAGFTVDVLPNTGEGAALRRIQATRKVWPNVWMDETGCDEYGGLTALSCYHEKKDAKRNVGLGPNHDWSSHSSDAFGEMALDYDRMTKATPKNKPKMRRAVVAGGWMGQ